MDSSAHNSGSSELDLDLEREYDINLNLPGSSPPPLQSFAAGGSESNAAYFSWPACRIGDAAEDRAHYFGNLQKGVLPEIHGGRPTGLQATTLLELMTIRAFHSKLLRRFSLGTAIGLRIRRGSLTDIPAILVFVGRKLHREWLNPAQCLPTALEVLCFFKLDQDLNFLGYLLHDWFCRDLEVFGVKLMWLNSHTTERLQLPRKSSSTPS